MSKLNSSGKNFGPNLPKVHVGGLPTIKDINQQSEYARMNTINSVVGGFISRGTSGTSVVLDARGVPQLTPWKTYVGNGEVRVVLGGIWKGSKFTNTKNKLANDDPTAEDLSQACYGNTTKVPFFKVPCIVPNAVFEKGGVWKFPFNSNLDSIVYVNMSGSPKLDYISLDAYLAEEPVFSVPIAVTLKDGRVVQLTNSDIFDFTGKGAVPTHPFKVSMVEGSAGFMRLERGAVYSYPNDTIWVDYFDYRGTEEQPITNRPKWDSSVPNVGGQYLDDDNCQFPASSYGQEFDIYLKFQRNLAGAFPPQDWATAPEYPLDPYWHCTVCIGSIPQEANQVSGNYNTYVRDPQGYKTQYIENFEQQIKTAVTSLETVPPVTLTLTGTWEETIRNVKFFSYGIQYYNIARVKKETVTVYVDEDGNEYAPVEDEDGNLSFPEGVTPVGEVTQEIRTIYVVNQTLRSDFYFYPPLDAAFQWRDLSLIQLDLNGAVISWTETHHGHTHEHGHGHHHEHGHVHHHEHGHTHHGHTHTHTHAHNHYIHNTHTHGGHTPP